MGTQTLFHIFLALCVVGIVLSLILPGGVQRKICGWIGCLAAVALAAAGADALIGGKTFTEPLWVLPGLATLSFNVDRLSALFLTITGTVLFPASIFASVHFKSGKSFVVMLLGLYAAIGLILAAGDALLFLLAWELMSALCYLLIVSGREGGNGAPASGYLLLTMGEAGTLATAMGFLVLGMGSNGLDFAAIRAASPTFGTGLRWAVFLLSLFGFGVKAGLVPVNFWLPPAYVSAPRAFVPVLAGATLNLGLYGIFRVDGDLMPPGSVAPGVLALVIGTISALVGILYATIDNDLKLMLAHSSIENAGIIIAGFGAGIVFVAAGHPAAGAIAFTASLYHLLNHSCYKTLLFFGVGAVETQTGVRDMDRLGGLIKWMPLTALAFLLGTLSIAALPPFNGFVSEWLTLQTMLRSSELSSAGVKMIFALCGAGLALTAALAVTCFVKVFAMSFLGMRRLENNRQVNEPKSGTLVPLLMLALLCVALGVLPTYVIPGLDRVITPLTGASAAEQLTPPFFAKNPALPPAFIEDFHNLGAQVGRGLPGRGLVVLHRGGTQNPVVFAMSTSYMLGVLVVLLLSLYLIVRVGLTRRRRVVRQPRWDGGLRRLLPEMTYTATGFSNSVRVIFDAVFRPTTVVDTRQTVAEHFLTAIRREKEQVHLVDKLVLKPVRDAAMWCARMLAAMHHGRFNAYAAYALLALLVVLILTLLV